MPGRSRVAFGQNPFLKPADYRLRPPSPSLRIDVVSCPHFVHMDQMCSQALEVLDLPFPSVSKLFKLLFHGKGVLYTLYQACLLCVLIFKPSFTPQCIVLDLPVLAET